MSLGLPPASPLFNTTKRELLLAVTALSQHDSIKSTYLVQRHVTAAPGCSAWADKALLIKKEGSTRCAGSSVPQVSQSVGAGLIKLNKLHFQHHICTIVLFCFYIKKKY